MQLRRCSFFTQCAAHQSRDGRRTSCQCHGHGSDVEHSTFWYVSINGQPDGCCSHCRRAWSLNPDALHSHASRSLVPWFTQGQSRSDEGSLEQQQSNMCLGWTDSNLDGWPNERDDRLDHVLGVTKLVTPRNVQKPRLPESRSIPDRDHRVRLSVRYFPDPLA